jgi:hypothetical protein
MMGNHWLDSMILARSVGVGAGTVRVTSVVHEVFPFGRRRPILWNTLRGSAH